MRHAIFYGRLFGAGTLVFGAGLSVAGMPDKLGTVLAACLACMAILLAPEPQR